MAQGDGQVAATGSGSGQKPHGTAGQEAQDECDRQRAHVDLGRREARQLRGEESHRGPQRAIGEGRAQEAAYHREQQPLEDERTRDLCAARTQRGPDSTRCLPLEHAPELEVRHVRAGYDEQQQRAHQEGAQGLTSRAQHLVDQRFGAGHVARMGVGKRALYPFRDDLQLGAGRMEPDSRAQPSQHSKDATMGGRHLAQRHEDPFLALSETESALAYELGGKKHRRHHPDDHDGLASEGQGRAHDTGIGRESPPPEGVADHHDAGGGRGAIVGREGAAPFRAQAQQGKGVACDTEPFDFDRLREAGQGTRGGAEQSQPLERARLLPPKQVVEAGDAGAGMAQLRHRVPERDELVRPRDREGAARARRPPG